MRELKVQITKFVDDYQPGVVECEFHDAHMTLHRVVDKVPIFTCQYLWSDSHYPQAGTIRCEVLEQTIKEDVDTFVKITTDRPDGVKSTRGLSEFWVRESEVI